MRQDLATFRRSILEAMRGIRTQRPTDRLLLLYDPNTQDPLTLTDPAAPPRHEFALIPWGRQARGGDKSRDPRVIELDCRRTAPYLLESDPALDDPLFEASLTLTHAGNTAICGWLSSPDDTATVARRFTRCMPQTDPADGSAHDLRWHDPRVTAILWPQLSAAQRTALLSNGGCWLGLDGAGHEVIFDCPAIVSADDASLRLTPAQWRAVHQVGLLNDLLARWRQQRGTLPPDATGRLQRHVNDAERLGFAGRDLQVYALTAVQSHAGHIDDARWRVAVQAALESPGTLADHLPSAARKELHD